MHTRENRCADAKHALPYLGAMFALPLAASVVTAPSTSSPMARPPYSVRVFAPPPAGLTNPDSITEADGNIFVTYANGSLPDGSKGSSTVVQYSFTGQIIRTYAIAGKNDGL